MDKVLREVKPSYDCERVLSLCLQACAYQSFRNGQKEALLAYVNAHVSSQCAAVLLPTSAGKSFLIQCAPVLNKWQGRPALTLVVEPLINLLIEQDAKASKLGLKCVTVHGKQSGKTSVGLSIKKITDGDIVFLTPESLPTISKLHSTAVGGIIIDEFHVISTWGRSFRPMYRSLGQLHIVYGRQVPILLLSATATRIVFEDVCESLCIPMRKMILSVHGSMHSNVAMFLKEKTSRLETDLRPLADIIHQVVRLPKEEQKGNSIIFFVHSFPTMVKVDAALRCYPSAFIRGLCKTSSDLLHSLNHSKANQRILEYSNTGRTLLTICTTAGSLGLDFQNVNYVFIYGGTSLETMTQMIGRAGRRGQPSEVYIMARKSDLSRLRSQLTKHQVQLSQAIAKERPELKRAHKILEASLTSTEDFLFNSQGRCLMVQLLKNFMGFREGSRLTSISGSDGEVYLQN